MDDDKIIRLPKFQFINKVCSGGAPGDLEPVVCSRCQEEFLTESWITFDQVYLPEGISCPKCLGSSSEPQSQTEVDMEAERQRKTAARLADFLEDVPLAYHDNDITDPRLDNEVARATLEWLASDRTKGLGLSGQSRIGKTRCLWHIAKEIHMGSNKSFEFIKMFHFTTLVCSEVYSDNKLIAEAAAAKLKRLIGVNFLLIDDLGKEKLTEKGEEQFFNVIDTRLEWKRPVLFSSNKTNDEIAHSLSESRGSALLNRLMETCDIHQF